MTLITFLHLMEVRTGKEVGVEKRGRKGKLKSSEEKKKNTGFMILPRFGPIHLN